MTSTTMRTRATTWGERADAAQRSLRMFWGASDAQLLHRDHPSGAALRPDGTDHGVLDYWWLAHVVDCRLDAHRRTGEATWLDDARRTAAHVVARNGSLFNDYFDDMLWFGLALLRLADAEEGAGGTARPTAERAGAHEPPLAGSEHAEAAARDAVVLWEHVLADGVNDRHGWSVSWRRQQPGYKNTPANGPFAILGARLARRTGDARYLDAATRSVRWLQEHLVRADGFVWDGLGREGGDAVDRWRFSYNPGLVVGACVELFRCTGEGSWLDEAQRVALASIRELTRDGVFLPEAENPADDAAGGDVGLFKGIWFRYAEQLLLERDVPEVAAVIRASTDALWEHARVDAGGAPLAAPIEESGTTDGVLLRAGDDWRRAAPTRVGYSTHLSAVMALEVRARLEASTPTT